MKKSKMGAAALVGALGAVGLLGVSTAAFAAPSNIDVNEDRSLTIHAYEQPVDVGAATTGEELPASATQNFVPLEGVSFTASPVTSIGGVPLDLLDSASWDLIAPYVDGTQAFDPADATLGTPLSGATNAQGTVTFADPQVGAFWVQQTGNGANNVFTPMDPFLITIPLPSATPGEWIYDVHAYPKNAVLGGEKTVDETGALGLGSTVSWTVTGDIPTGSEALTSYSIVDTLPAGLSYTVDSADVYVNNGPDLGGGQQLEEGIDYNITVVDQVVTMDLTAEGLLIIDNFRGDSVSFSLVSAVNAVGTGTLVNNAVINVNDTSYDVQAQTTWGAVEITKHVTDDIAKVLGGAEFQVFASMDDATALTNPISVAGETTFTTDDTTGVVVIPGLLAAVGGTEYYLVETKAPTGYLANTVPQEITVVPGSIATALDVAVPNDQAPAGMLPQLGGTGTMIAGILGAAALALGLSFAVVSRRKKAETAEAQV